LLTSCDYAKQQKDITELKSKNIELSKKLGKIEIENIIKSGNEIKNPHRLRAIRIIDSLRFNDPKTFEQIEKEIEINSTDIE